MSGIIPEKSVAVKSVLVDESVIDNVASDVLTYITSVRMNWETLGSGLRIEGRGEEKYRWWRKEVCERSESFFCQAWELNSVVSHSVHDFGHTTRQTQRNGNSYRSTVISNPVHILSIFFLLLLVINIPASLAFSSALSSLSLSPYSLEPETSAFVYLEWC